MIVKPVEPDYKKKKVIEYVSSSICDLSRGASAVDLGRLAQFMSENQIDRIRINCDRFDGDVRAYYFREETDQEASNRYQKEYTRYQNDLIDYNKDRERIIEQLIKDGQL